MSDWTWEYVPDTASVVGGLTSEQIAEVEALAVVGPDADLGPRAGWVYLELPHMRPGPACHMRRLRAAAGIELPRVSRTGKLRLIHAASCPFRYSSWTSCGVL